MKLFEKWIIAAICIGISAAFTSYYLTASPLKHLDTVFLYESSLSVISEGYPTSNTVKTWPIALKTFTVPADVLCQADLQTAESQEKYNVFKNHAYSAIYPISIGTALFGPEITFSTLNAISHVLILIIPFYFLRKTGTPVLACLSFSLCIALYPAWSYSATGDYYLDRLYMPLALLSLFLIHQIATTEGKIAKPLTYAYIIILISAASLTERAAIMMLGEVIFFLAFYPTLHKDHTLQRKLIGIAFLIGSYLFIYFKFIFVGIEGGGNILKNSIVVLLNPIQRLSEPGIQPFILVNFLSIGILAAFSGARYLLLAIASILPNILITTGGAELNGWATHYHAMYIPFIIFAATIGYKRVISRASVRYQEIALPTVLFIYAALIASSLNPHKGRFENPSLSFLNTSITGKLYTFFFTPINSYEIAAGALLGKLDQAIPKGSKVSAVEGVMPSLYSGRSISYYPINMDSSDFLVLQGEYSSGKLISTRGATSYLGEKERIKLNECLHQRLTRNGYVLHNEIPQMGVVVFRRGQF